MPSFWSDYDISADGKGFEPKRKFTYLLSIAGKDLSLENYLIKKVKKPSFEISQSEHKFLNHTFKYPGKLTWKDVTFTIVDTINPNGTEKFLAFIEKCGYHAPVVAAGPSTPGNQNFNAQTISKLRSVEALGKPILRQIDHDGRIVEEWVMEGAWIKDVDFGELDNDSDDLMNIEVTLAYDYAYCNIKQPETKTFPSNVNP